MLSKIKTFFEEKYSKSKNFVINKLKNVKSFLYKKFEKPIKFIQGKFKSIKEFFKKLAIKLHLPEFCKKTRIR